jgi:carbon-monoxide dehydrogenase medium subunit
MIQRKKMLWKNYRVAKTIEEALETLRADEGGARIIAGGTDLIPRLKDGALSVECVVDIGGIDHLKKIGMEGDLVVIGATVTHHEIVSSGLLKEKVPLIVEAAAEVGTPQVRNQGTVLGNIINAQPAADTAVALLALGAEVGVAYQNELKWLPLGDLYEGIGVSKVKSNRELAVGVRCSMIQRNQGCAYLRMRGRNDHWLPTLNTAVVVTTENKKFVSASIVVAPVAPRPFRAKHAEEMMKDAPLTDKVIVAAAQKASEEAYPRDSFLRGSGAYRKEIVAILVRDGLRKALRNVKEKTGSGENKHGAT